MSAGEFQRTRVPRRNAVLLVYADSDRAQAHGLKIAISSYVLTFRNGKQRYFPAWLAHSCVLKKVVVRRSETSVHFMFSYVYEFEEHGARRGRLVSVTSACRFLYTEGKACSCLKR